MTREEFDSLLAGVQNYLKKFVWNFERNSENQKDLIQETNMRACKYYHQFSGDEVDMRKWITSVMRTVVNRAFIEKTRLKNNPTSVVILSSHNQEKRTELQSTYSLDQFLYQDRMDFSDSSTPEDLLLKKEENAVWEKQWKNILKYQKHPDWDILWSFYQKEDHSLTKSGKWVPIRTEKYKEISRERGGDLSAEQLKKKVFQLKQRMIRELT